MKLKNSTAVVCLLVLVLYIAAGCSWPSAAGQRHLVFGFGIITTSTNQSGVSLNPLSVASAERIVATGLLAGPGPVVNGIMAGHTKRQTVTMPVHADLIIDATTTRDGGFHVEIHSPTNLLINTIDRHMLKGNQ